MRKIKQIWAVLFALFMLISYIGCNNDDDETSPEQKVTTTSYTGSFTLANESYDTLKISTNRTYTMTGSGTSDSGTWKYSSERSAVSLGDYVFTSNVHKTTSGANGTFLVSLTEGGCTLTADTGETALVCNGIGTKENNETHSDDGGDGDDDGEESGLVSVPDKSSCTVWYVSSSGDDLTTTPTNSATPYKTIEALFTAAAEDENLSDKVLWVELLSDITTKADKPTGPVLSSGALLSSVVLNLNNHTLTISEITNKDVSSVMTIQKDLTIINGTIGFSNPEDMQTIFDWNALTYSLKNVKITKYAGTLFSPSYISTTVQYQTGYLYMENCEIKDFGAAYSSGITFAPAIQTDYHTFTVLSNTKITLADTAQCCAITSITSATVILTGGSVIDAKNGYAVYTSGGKFFMVGATITGTGEKLVNYSSDKKLLVECHGVFALLDSLIFNTKELSSYNIRDLTYTSGTHKNIIKNTGENYSIVLRGVLLLGKKADITGTVYATTMQSGGYLDLSNVTATSFDNYPNPLIYAASNSFDKTPVATIESEALTHYTEFPFDATPPISTEDGAIVFGWPSCENAGENKSENYEVLSKYATLYNINTENFATVSGQKFTTTTAGYPYITSE